MKLSGHLQRHIDTLAGEPVRRIPAPPCPASATSDLPAVRAAVGQAWAACRLPADWAWEVRESSRTARVGLSVTRDCVLVITVPPGARPGAVAQAVKGRSRWIIHQVAEALKVRPAYKVARLINGEGFAWLGSPARLDIVPDGRLASYDDVRRHVPNLLAGTPGADEPWFDRDGFGRWLRLPVSLGDGAEAVAAIIRLYTAAGAAFARERVHGHDPYNRLAGLELTSNPPAIDAGDTGEEWVRYRARVHTVTLHWAVSQLPLTLVDYLITQGLVLATRPKGGRGGPEYRRKVTRIVHVPEPLERDLTEATRHLWMGETETA